MRIYGLIKHKSAEAINLLPEKTRRIIFDALKSLENNPWPGAGNDKEKLRLHIRRSYTIFYKIYNESHVVLVHDVMIIEQAHKKYSRM
ncbi:hypothetical protein L1994_03235 [Methanomicrobium antiquum]|uniref:Type II toxin-antitoxin system RelE/ParE family toxin n=1 Tax=Methanomicrobium antiquum TaxID=487686 RepID=A0AAF0JNC3_9EURY|nr:hypothetical protein [Methanomicrobium antiquum]WFN37420.1 hypothetical protein L1994_03235 [Methanomicrobium antiquum]